MNNVRATSIKIFFINEMFAQAHTSHDLINGSELFLTIATQIKHNQRQSFPGKAPKRILALHVKTKV